VTRWQAVLAEIGGALLGGVVGGALAGAGAWALLSGAGLGMGLLVAAIFAVALGFGAGAGAGAALTGRAAAGAGNPGLAVLGGVLGGAVAALALRYLYLGIDLLLFPVVAAPLAVAGAVVGYNLRRRPPPRDGGGRRRRSSAP
jgi:hypothetical protein